MDRPVGVRVLEFAAFASAVYSLLVAVLYYEAPLTLIVDLFAATAIILLTLLITRRRSGNAWVAASVLGVLWVGYFCYLLLGEGLYRELDLIPLFGALCSLTFLVFLFSRDVRRWVN